MLLRNQLLENPSLEFHNNIFYQKNLPRNNPFEEVYFKVREREGRVYLDHVVRKLPEFDPRPNGKEWQMRKSTLYELMKYLRKSGVRKLLELGCGNGWLAYNLAITLKIEICAVDINEMELLQGARVFGEQVNLCFVYADVFSNTLETQKFGAVVLGSSIQYFKYKIYYNPRSFVSLFKRKLLNIPLSIFPIICISPNTALEHEKHFSMN